MKEIELREYIRFYVPKGWIEDIQSVSHIPYFTKEEYDKILKGNIPDCLDTPYFIEAINEYLKEGE